jgi:hypothetical protein
MKNTTTAGLNMSQKDVQSNTLPHYNSINDCPIWNYNQAIEKNDSRYLYILTDYSKLPEKALDKLLDTLWWQYLDEKGFDVKFKLAYDYKIQIAELEFEQAQGMNRTVELVMARQELKDLFKGKTQKLSEQIAILSKFMGYQLDPKKITVYDFIGIENLFIEHGKAKPAVTR